MATITPDTTVDIPDHQRQQPSLTNSDLVRLWLGYLVRLAVRLRTVWLMLAALTLALIAQSVSQQGFIDAGFRLYLVACSIFVVAFLFTYRSHRYIRVGRYTPPSANPAPPLVRADVAESEPAVASRLPVRHHATTTLATPNPHPITRLPVRRPAAATSTLPSSSSVTRLPVRHPATTTLPPPNSRIRTPNFALAPLRILLVIAACGLGLQSAIALAGAHFDSFGIHIETNGNEFNNLAVLGTVAACLLLLLACFRQRHAVWPLQAANPDELHPDSDVPAGAAIRPSRREWLILAAILMFAAFLRLYNLEYTPMGLTIDEGDIGLFAQRVAHGDFSTTPLLGVISWYQLPAIIPLIQGLSLKLFGLNSAFALRLPSALTGILVVFFFYKLLRLMFGVRVALIGAALLAVANEQIRFSAAAQGGEQMGLLWLLSFYFLAKGLRSKRYLDFAASGLAAGFSFYFYPSSKLIVGLLAAYFVYLTVTRLRFLRDYWSHLLVVAAATFIIAAPISLYTINNARQALNRLQDVSILTDSNAAELFAVYHQSYKWTGTLTVTGFLQNLEGWKVVLPQQAILSYRALNLVPEYPFGKYSFYQSSRPLLPPQEAVIVILGLAYSLWRWRDPRYMLLNIWFWLGIFVAVAITILTPDYQRIAGVDLSIYAFPALALAQMSFALERAWFSYYPQVRDSFALKLSRFRQQVGGWLAALLRPTLRVRPASFALSFGNRYLNIALVAVIALYAFQNLFIYYNDFNKGTCPWAMYNAPAYYIRANLASDRVYYAGWPNEVYSPQDTMFLVPPNINLNNLSAPYDLVPFHQAITQSVAFLFHDSDAAYISGLQQLYPDGNASLVSIPCPGFNLHSFTVPATVIAAHQQLNLHYDYNRASGPANLDLATDKFAFSHTNAPPALLYPALATWSGSLYAPQYGHYRFRITAANPQNTSYAGNATLYLDNRPWLSVPAATITGTVDLVMAEGWHSLALKANLHDANQQVRLLWQPPGVSLDEAIPAYYLWNGALANRPFGMLGELSSADDHKLLQRKLLPQPSTNEIRPELHVGNIAATLAWSGTLNPPTPGLYTISVASFNATVTATLDGQPFTLSNFSNGQAGFSYSANLDVRPYHLQLNQYIPAGNQPSPLILSWTPPNGVSEQIPPAALRPPRSSYTVAEIGDLSDLPPAQVEANTAPPLQPSLVINTDQGDVKSQPTAIGVDAVGNIYVGDNATHKVLKYNSQGKLLTSWNVLPNGKEGPSIVEDLQVLPNGNVVVMDVTNKNIQVFDSNGKYLYNVDKDNKYAAYAPNGLATYSDGNIYIANTGGNNIYKLDPADNMLATFGQDQKDTAAHHLDQPVDLALDEQGNMYVADLKQRIVKYDPQGHYLHQWPLNVEVGKVAYYAGVVYVVSPHSNAIYAVNTTDDSITVYGSLGANPGQFDLPINIAVDANGNLYVAEMNNRRIQVFPHPSQ